VKIERIPVPAGTARGLRVPAYPELSAAAVAAAVIWLLMWYGETVGSMVSTWNRSDTFTHGFLVVPISAWLMWRRRHELAHLPVRPDFLALPVFVILGLAWLLGALAGVIIVQQCAVVAMIAVVVWAMAGSRVVRSLAFPLLFLLFAIPFGDFLLPPLMQHTADFTVAALKLSGVPVYREGLYFTLPSGSWSVVEACSGLRYLIASLTVGVLYAHLTYRSAVRRGVFICAAIVVPIVANWARAYAIVMIGHLSSMQYAVGIDHLVYGWLFFGVVMLLLFWIGLSAREDMDEAAQSEILRPAHAQSQAPISGAIVAAAVAVAVLTAVWPIAAERVEARSAGVARRLDVPAGALPWQQVDKRLTTWTPHFVNAAAEINQVYGAEPHAVGLSIRYYSNQRQGAELITSTNTLVRSTDRVWGNVGEKRRRVEVKGQQLALAETNLRGPGKRLLVWSWYRIDGRDTAEPYWSKLVQAWAKLRGRGGDSAVIIVYTEFDGTRDAAVKKLQAFVDAMRPAINRSVDHAL
jgi:exosortase A